MKAYLITICWQAAWTLLLTSCATNILYRDGKPVARLQGDMTNVRYQDKEILFTADRIENSKATIAGGNAVSKGILASGTAIATSGLTQLAK